MLRIKRLMSQQVNPSDVAHGERFSEESLPNAVKDVIEKPDG
jgi:hypothetical protein